MGLFSTIGSWFQGGRMQTVAAPPNASAAVVAPTQAQLMSVLGPPKPLAPLQDNIASTVWAQPYNGPLDFDPYATETAAMRYQYRTMMRANPVVRAAIRGKADDISVLEPIVLPANKDDPVSQEAAEFVKYTIDQSPRGWRGLIDSIYTAASVDGYSICEKKLKPQRWKGKAMWGLAHVRNLDTAVLRVQMDIYRNVIAIVNMVRGLEYYDPDDVILYAHNPMYSSPFGQSDMRAAVRAGNIIQDVYLAWFTALQVYGLPYMKGKVANGVNTEAMAATLAALRSGGYAVTTGEDDIEVLNLAAAAGTSAFKDMVQVQREDIFFAIRGVAQPFMEGKGGTDSHTDTSIQQGTSDAGEKASSLDVADCINKQLIPWLVRPNFGDIDMPIVKLGGTDWKVTKDIVGILKDAQSIGVKIPSQWAHEQLNIPVTDDDKALEPPGSSDGQPGGMPGKPPGAGGEAQSKQAPALPAPEAKPEPKALPAAKSEPEQPATFSEHHKPGSVDPAIVARAVDRLLAEFGSNAA